MPKESALQPPENGTPEAAKYSIFVKLGLSTIARAYKTAPRPRASDACRPADKRGHSLHKSGNTSKSSVRACHCISNAAYFGIM